VRAFPAGCGRAQAILLHSNAVISTKIIAFVIYILFFIVNTYYLIMGIHPSPNEMIIIINRDTPVIFYVD